MKIIIIIFFTLISSPAYANVPIGAALVINYPAVVSLTTYGLGLLCVILIESLILRKWMKLSYFRSILLASEVNVFSTIIGALIVLAFNSGDFLMMLFLPAVIIFTHFGKKLYITTKNSLKYKDTKFIYPLFFIFFTLLGALSIYLSLKLIPYQLIKYDSYDSIIQLPSTFITIVIMLLLIAEGFIITIITEGYYLSKRKNINTDLILPAIFQMNVFSYIVLLISTGFYQYQDFINIGK